MTSEMFWMKAVKSGRARWTATMEPFGFVGVAAQLHMLLVLMSQSYRCTSRHYSIIKNQKVKLEFEVFICLELLILTIPEGKKQHFADFGVLKSMNLYSTQLI